MEPAALSTFDTLLTADVEAVLAFNRFYDQRLERLSGHTHAGLSATEIRVLSELAHRQRPSAKDLARDLALDAGYLSRLLRRFAERGWLARQPAATDGRQHVLQLTETGLATLEPLREQLRQEVAQWLQQVPSGERPRLLQAMASVQRLLEPDAAAPNLDVVLRAPGPGDLGWVVQQHGELYAREHGWNMAFEAQVAAMASDLILQGKPEWERGWIAELDEERVGSAFVFYRSTHVAQLRFLLVRPEARGLGLGSRLVGECVAFARSQGYRRLATRLVSQQATARKLFERLGFALGGSEPYQAYGRSLLGENWELPL